MNKSTSSTSQLGASISSSVLIDSKLEEHQLCGSKHCPGCGHKLETKPDWVGLPAGVKFDPTDQELIEHLEAKVEAKDTKSHPLIDEFIPTIEGEDGICYTHPEKLPGVTRDGLSKHFFHRPSKAYTTGTRKRRKIQTECDLQGGETRWHKTGKTRPVMVNGRQKGCKKILVLYTNFGKNRKPEKTNWVMHQYHLGQHEEEREGELVVSKIFYQTQPRQCNLTERGGAAGGEGSSERRESGGSGSCSSKEVTNTMVNMGQMDQLSTVGVSMSSAYNAMEIQQLKPEHFGFDPFRKSFDEVGVGVASTTREAQVQGTCDECNIHHLAQHELQQHQEQHQQYHHQQQLATSSFHISRPSHPISTIISAPPLHHASIILDEHSFHVSRMMLPNDNFQQQHHHKMEGRSASELEELIMGCTSSTTANNQITDQTKQESSIVNPQEAEWLKYSSFWPDPDNPDPHG